MTMKKNIIIYLAAAFLAAVTSGCSVNEEGIYGSFPYLEVDIDSKSITKVASSDAIAIKTNRKISVSVDANASWLTAVVEGEQLVLSWKENVLETIREAVVTLSTPNSLVTRTLKVTQDASGELTVQGDLILHSKEEIASNTYTKTTGDLIIGNVTSIMSKATSTSVSVELDGRILTASPTDINDVDVEKLKDQIHMIEGKGVAVVNTKAKTIPVEIISANGVQEVSFDYNNMKSLPSADVLQSLNLRELSIKGNPVTDISALAGCSTIEILDISGTEVYDLDPIIEMAGLQKVVIDNLPISAPKLEVFREQCDNIEVIATEVRPDNSPLPVFGTVETTVLSETQVMITVRIDANATDITNAGFYIGKKRDLDNMTWHSASYSDGVLSLTYDVDTLEDVIYYVRAYAENATGGDYSKAGYFGSLTAKEDVFIKSYEDLQNFYDNTYSHVEGSVFVGNTTTSGTSGIKLDDGKHSMYFKSTDLSDLSKLNQLVYVRDGLYIGNVGLSKMEYISHIAGMKTLWLKGNGITKIPELECAETLTYLDVSMNDLTDVAFVAKMPALETLYLGSAANPQNETNDIGLIADLADYQNLTYIDLCGLPVHQWQVDDLRAAMPNTEIVFSAGGRDPHIPTVKTARAVRSETDVTLNGVVTSKGKSDIIEYGFYYGKEGSVLEKYVVGESIQTGETFSYTIEVQDLDVYYWYPYAVNSQGESRNSISEFTLAYEDLSQNGTANCYLIHAPGKYKFNAAVRGNSSESVGKPYSAEVVWEFRDPGYLESIISEVNLNKDGYVEFEIMEDAVYGNALIAVKDEIGTILWSWHIWLCDFDAEASAHKYKSGNMIMDRHLGATIGDSFNSYEEKDRAAGTLYQWGRKDPFTQWTITSTVYGFYTVEEANAQPTVYGVGEKWTYDINNRFWSPEQKTIYDPCPPGWKVADKNTWDDLSAYGQDDYGLSFEYDNQGNDVRYPFGYYYDSNFNYYNSIDTYIWTSEYIDGSNAAWALYYSYWSWGLNTDRYHTDGYSVRCMKDVGFVVTTGKVLPESESAVVYGNVTYNEATVVSERGFVFSSDTSAPTLNNSSSVASGAGQGDFSATLTDLRPNTTYYVRAYATGEDVTRYGAVVSYKTAVSGESDDDFTEDDYEWE